MPNAKPTEPLEQYLEQVRRNLRDWPAEDAAEIILELRSHVLDRVDGDVSEANIRRALDLLGDPREIARINMTTRVAAGAANRTSPRVIVRALFRLARLSVRGLVTLAVSLLGYSFAAVWSLTALAKPFLPDRIGLFVLPDPTGDLSLTLGRLDAGLTGREILGWWIIPIGLALGIASAVLTFRFHQRAIRKMARPALDPRSSES